MIIVLKFAQKKKHTTKSGDRLSANCDAEKEHRR